MAYRLTDEDRRIALQQAMRQVQLPQASTASTSRQPNKGFWLDQLSTGGGIGGALGGAALGASVGSVVPVIGTAIGGLAGALIGGGLGSAGGEMAENAITGEDLTKNVLREGLIGGATSLPITSGLKLARAGGKALTGSRAAAKDLVQEAGVQSIGRGTVRRMGARGTLDEAATEALGRVNAGRLSSRLGRAGSRAEQKAGQMLASQSLLTPSQARNMGIRPVDTFSAINRSTGLTNIDDMAEFGRGLTGAGDDSLLDTMTRAAIEEAPGIKLPDLRKTAQDLIDDGGSLLSDSQRKNLINHVKNASTTMYGGSRGTLSSMATPGVALDQANAFRQVARDLTNGFNVTPENRQLGKIYNSLAKTIEDGIYSAPGVNQSIPSIIRGGADDLLFRAQGARAAGNEAIATAYERMASQLREVKDVAGLRSLKRPFVELSKIDNATAQAQAGRTLGGADLSRRAGEVVRNPMNLVALPLDAATPRIGGALASAGRRLQSAGSSVAPQAGQSLAGAAARQGAGRALSPADTAEPYDMGLEQALLAQEAMQAEGAGLPAQPGVEATQEATNPLGYSSAQLGQALMAALAAGDRPAAERLQAMYTLAQEFETQANPQTNLSASERAAQTKSMNALNTVNTLEEALNAAGGGQGRIAGTLANFTGSLGLNDSVSAYNDVSRGSMAQILRGLGESGALSDGDVQRGLAMLPKVTDTPGEVQTKMQILRGMIEQAALNPAGSGAVAAAPGL